jgi:transposase
MLADRLDYVVGVDPHRDTHALAILEVRTGGVVFETSLAASGGGYARALELAREHAPGRRAFAVEGSGSFGAGLTRFLAGQGERVLEVGACGASAARAARSPGRTAAGSGEAAFARLAVCTPIPASSGQTVRYRLDRSGDRRLNRALHMILVTRRRAHPPTIAYIDRRIQEGKSRREASCCLKRYLARNLYRLLEHGAPLTT